MVDLVGTAKKVFEIIQVDLESDMLPESVGLLFKDGDILLKLILRLYPSSIWSLFPLTDAKFDGVFIYTKVCADLGIQRDVLPDPFDILCSRNVYVLIRSFNILLSSPNKEGSLTHSGPKTDESEICSCLSCRWRNMIRVFSSSSHAWSPTRLPISLRRLVEEGIPTSLREHAWLILSGGLHLMRTRRPDYAALFPMALESRHVELIDLDISRTFQEFPDWRARGLDLVTRRILAAYSLRNSSVGYCQGLSYIVGLLATVTSEESAFVILCAIIEDGLLPPDYYTTLQGAVIDRQVLEHLIASKLPRLTAILDDQLSDYSFMSIPWNMCLFTTAFPKDISVRVWDFLFAFGPCVLFRTALGLVQELESKLINGLPVSEIRSEMKRIEDTTTARDLLAYLNRFTDIDNDTVGGLRDQIRLSRTDSCSPYLSVVGSVEEPLSNRVSDEGYFGLSVDQSAPASERRRQREARKRVMRGLSQFMNGI